MVATLSPVPYALIQCDVYILLSKKQYVLQDSFEIRQTLWLTKYGKDDTVPVPD
jgi:hypothetical protein